MTAPKSLLWLLLVLLSETILAEEVVLSVNIKKPLVTTSDKFLSFTLDPAVILTGNLITDNREKSVNMAKALSPAYVRIASPRTNSYSFVRGQTTPEQDNGFAFTETNWNSLNEWASSSGLDVLMGIAPQQHSEGSGSATRDTVWDSRNILDLISFSDHMEYNVSWQLGYECQTRCDINGGDLGKDVTRLRNMLEAFPRYARSIIAGPDVVTFKTKLQQIYLQEYLNAGIGGLSAITWHPEFASIAVDPIGVSMHHDNLGADKDALYRIIGRHMAKKPLWLAESRSEECKKQFLGALVWTRRLGNSAKVGAQVLMRQPQDSNLLEPTPDYWVSVLHKSLVGREVLDTKIATGNRTHIHFYCQCTKPSSKYEKGSLTVFGMNLTPAKLVVSLKGLKIKTLHKYILLPGFDAENRMFSETVLLNNEPLTLKNGTDLPEINPAIATSGKGLSMKLPSGGIGFWVIPDLKIKSCEGQENDNVDKMLLKKLSKRLEEMTDSEEDNDNEEMGESKEMDDNNSEERRLFVKTSLANKKRRSRKNQRYSSTEEDEITRYKKLDARKDLERLEKLLKWRENLEEKRLLTLRGKPAHIGFEDKSYESSSGNESEEEIRAKLQLYKRRLDEYGARRKNSVRSKDKLHVPPSPENDALDNENIEEAMRLITKVENSIKSFEQQNDHLLLENQPSNNTADAEEQFLDELLKTRKIKRASVPERIEEQLRTIYEMLAEEKKRRQKINSEMNEGTSGRTKRDVDTKKFGDDPLGLRKDSFFTRRRNRNDETKERRFGRNRKKDDNGPVIIDQNKNSRTDSNENNFYGFGKREPIRGFPEGDVYIMTGVSSEEKNNDYDYIGDDEDTLPDQGRRKKSKNAEPLATSNAEIEEPWLEDINDADIGYIPKEFLENVHLNAPKIDKHLENYSELWEAESLADAHLPNNNQQDEDLNGEEKIMRENPLDERLERQAKETAVKQLMGYYESSISQQSQEMDDTVFQKPRKENQNSHSKVPRQQNQRKLSEPPMRKRIKDIGRPNESEDTVNFRRPVASSIELEAIPRFAQETQSKVHSRPRRNLKDLDSVLNKEMIFQDENNLKDCNCRVIRGGQRQNHNCKLSERLSQRKERTEAKRISRKTRNKGTRVMTRNRRDTESEEEYDYNEENTDYADQATIEDEQTTKQQEITTSEPPTTTSSTTTTTLPITKEKAKVFRAEKNIHKTQANTKSTRQVKNIEPQQIQTESPTTISPMEISHVSTSATSLQPIVESAERTTHTSNINKTAYDSLANLSLENATTIESVGETKPVGIKRNHSKIQNEGLKAGSSKNTKEPSRLIGKSDSSNVSSKNENVNKKMRKPLTDSSLKRSTIETDKLDQLHRKRLEQLEKLREKIKTKRSKFQESISLDELTRLNDGKKAKTHKRREIVELLTDPDNDGELQNIVEKGKWNYVMLYKPINYGFLSNKIKSSNKNINDKLINIIAPVAEKSNDDLQSHVPIVIDTAKEECEQNTDGLVITNYPINEANPYDAIFDDSTNPEHIDQYPPRLFNTEDERLYGNGQPEESLSYEINNKFKKPQLICLREDDDSIEASPEIVKVDGTHYIATTLKENNSKEGTKIYPDEKIKYKSPKYSRLAMGKSKITTDDSTEEKLDCPQQCVEESSNSNSNKYELMMLIPINTKKQSRQRREISNEITRSDFENSIRANIINLKSLDRKGTYEATTKTAQDPLSSLVEETIPKIGHVVTDGLGKAQNVTGSIEKLIDKIENNINETDNMDEKTQFEMAAKNNPDGLLTHDFFHNTIQNVRTFFDFLTGVTHIFFTTTSN